MSLTASYILYAIYLKSLDEGNLLLNWLFQLFLDLNNLYYEKAFIEHLPCSTCSLTTDQVENLGGWRKKWLFCSPKKVRDWIRAIVS